VTPGVEHVDERIEVQRSEPEAQAARAAVATPVPAQ
jgi:hypothetical protein